LSASVSPTEHVLRRLGGGIGESLVLPSEGSIDDTFAIADDSEPSTTMSPIPNFTQFRNASPSKPLSQLLSQSASVWSSPDSSDPDTPPTTYLNSTSPASSASPTMPHESISTLNVLDEAVVNNILKNHDTAAGSREESKSYQGRESLAERLERERNGYTYYQQQERDERQKKTWPRIHVFRSPSC
jgi:hypothetical protein